MIEHCCTSGLYGSLCQESRSIVFSRYFGDLLAQNIHAVSSLMMNVIDMVVSRKIIIRYTKNHLLGICEYLCTESFKKNFRYGGLKIILTALKKIN